MEFEAFFEACKRESTVSDFESYLAYCIFEKERGKGIEQGEFTLEKYSHIRDRAFDGRDEEAARLLYNLAGAAKWKEGDWEGALR
jgi:hypothetical protein